MASKFARGNMACNLRFVSRLRGRRQDPGGRVRLEDAAKARRDTGGAPRGGSARERSEGAEQRGWLARRCLIWRRSS